MPRISINTICRILRDLDRCAGTNEGWLRVRAAQSRMSKWLYRMRPDRPHQQFSYELGRYEDEGE